MYTHRKAVTRTPSICRLQLRPHSCRNCTSHCSAGTLGKPCSTRLMVTVWHVMYLHSHHFKHIDQERNMQVKWTLWRLIVFHQTTDSGQRGTLNLGQGCDQSVFVVPIHCLIFVHNTTGINLVVGICHVFLFPLPSLCCSRFLRLLLICTAEWWPFRSLVTRFYFYLLPYSRKKIMWFWHSDILLQSCFCTLSMCLVLACLCTCGQTLSIESHKSKFACAAEV